MTLVIHTDGACSGNPGPGGYGAWWQDGAARIELSGGDPGTTNNRMELLGVIRALQAVRDMSTPPAQVVVRSDSQYVVKGLNEWMAGWKRRAWKDVKNPDLWQLLDDLRTGLPVRFEWVRGHNGDPGNEHADLLARTGLAHARKAGKSIDLVDRTPSTPSPRLAP